MCGIAGIIDLKNQPVKENLLKQMMLKIKHRGPDDEGVFMDDNIGLGFVRLSVLDLSAAGHQPMHSSDNRFVIVFNGEIYNYIEIRTELSAKYKFITGTDTEVILAAYTEWGQECLHHFNGMFAFVIYDKIEKTIFGARDRFGVKPFYYYKNDNVFVFASEIPALLSTMEEKPKANEQVVFDYLAFNRTDQTNQTFFEGVFKLQHGQKFFIQNNILKIEKWYNLSKRNAIPFESSTEFKDLFIDAIKLRLRSDVEVGICLSGGLDSSSIVSTVIKNFKKEDLTTFSAIYGDNEVGDESTYINMYKEQVSSMFFTTPTANSLFEDKEKFIRAHAEPIPSTSPYAQFKVMELAKGKVVVTLDGQGADEHLAGYHYFFGFYFKDLLISLQFFTLFKEVFFYLKNHRSFYGIKTFFYFMLPNSLKTKLRVFDNGYINPIFAAKYSSSNSIVANLYASKNLKDALYNHFEYKLEHLLKWSDRNSMHFSIESRTPFLDYRLVERSLATPSEQKINNGNLKYILRNAMKGVLMEPLRARKDKVGFETPESKWFKEEKFQYFINEMISSASFENREFFNVIKIRKLYTQHLSGKIDISKEIWKWINLELWYREFID